MTDGKRALFSNKLDLDHFFYEARHQIYVVTKLADFPNYYKRSDIDVFCYDKTAFARVVLDVGNQYLDQGFEIRVWDKDDSHTYVDFYLDGELDFRFDLYGSLPCYTRVRLKEHYLYSVIENASVLHREHDGEEYPVYVPSPVDDLLLRYVEYIEWYELRPDKIKHLDYIMAAVSSDSSRIAFLDKLHVYTSLPDTDYGDTTGGYLSAFGPRMAWWAARAKSVPVYRLPGLVLRSLLSIASAVPKKLLRT